MKIPFYAPFHGAHETAYITDCLGTSLFTGGAYSVRALSFLKDFFKQEHLLLTPTCSSALELSVALLPLTKEDEVILPSFNFPSAANAVLRKGAVPVFCDIDPDTQNITASEIEKHLTKKTRAVISVDYAGIACDYASIRALTKEKGLYLIEDAAQSLGSFYRNEPLGIQGDLSGLSFHSTKNIACGEGGLFFCQEDSLFKKAQIYQMHGTNRQEFLDGHSDRYTWHEPGTSFPLNELTSALLFSQLEELSYITDYRKKRLFTYLDCLKPLEEKGVARQMKIPDYCIPNGHLYYLKFKNHELMEKARLYLASKGIDARTHYVPLHASPMGKSLGYEPSDLKVSLDTYETLLRLPVHTALSETEQMEICETLLDWGKQL